MYNVGGNVNWRVTVKNIMETLNKQKVEPSRDSVIPFLGI